MSKQLFDDAIGEVPPSTVDVDAAITRGRRAARVRHVVNPAVAAGVAVVLLTGAVAYTMTRDDGSDGMTVGTQPTPPPSTATTLPTNTADEGPQLPQACKRTDLELAEKLNIRLTGVLAAAVQQQRPEMTLTPNPGTAAPQRGPLEFFQVHGSKVDADAPICANDTYSLAQATTHGPEGAGNILVAVQPSLQGSSSLTCAETPAGSEETFCEVVTQPNGDVIRKTTSSFEGGTSGTRIDMIRADGTSVIITADNIDTTIKSGDAPTASSPPLLLQQLVAIGTAPGMTLFP
jgi:hypothetical protein